MCRKIVLLFLVLSIASVSYGTVDPISNWETTGSTDGWAVCTWGTQGDTIIVPGQTVGVTLGVGSLGSVKTLNHLDIGGKTWGWNIAYASYNSGGNDGVTSAVLTKIGMPSMRATSYRLISPMILKPWKTTGAKSSSTYKHICKSAPPQGGKLMYRWSILLSGTAHPADKTRSLETSPMMDGIDDRWFND